VSASTHEIPARYHGLFCATDGRLTFGLLRNATGTLRALVWEGERVRVDTVHMSFAPHTNAISPNASQRLDTLSLELETPGIGPVYLLMFSIENCTPGTFGDFRWIHPLPESPLSDLRLHAEYNASLTATMVGPWDDLAIDERQALESWIVPFSTFRRATEAEAAAHPSWQEAKGSPPRR